MQKELLNMSEDITKGLLMQCEEVGEKQLCKVIENGKGGEYNILTTIGGEE